MPRWIQAEKARYYQADLVQDLFGEWTLVCSWGGLGTALGGLSSTGVPSLEDGFLRLETIGKLRHRHGYLPADSLANRPIPTRAEKPPPSPSHRRRNNPAQGELDLGAC